MIPISMNPEAIKGSQYLDGAIRTRHKQIQFPL